MKDRLIIIGASGHGKVIADIAIKMKKWNTIEFLDDNKSLNTCLGLNVIGKTADYIKYINQADFFVAIGDNQTREKVQTMLEYKESSIISLIHPTAIIGLEVNVGKGTVVMAGVVINCSTEIGKGCIINTSSSIDHDIIIEDFVHISPGANLAGKVKVGKGSWIGIGSCTINNINIGRNCIIGAGSVVVKDLPENCTAMGCPAKLISINRKRILK